MFQTWVSQSFVAAAACNLLETCWIYVVLFQRHLLRPRSQRQTAMCCWGTSTELHRVPSVIWHVNVVFSTRQTVTWIYFSTQCFLLMTEYCKYFMSAWEQNVTNNLTHVASIPLWKQTAKLRVVLVLCRVPKSTWLHSPRASSIPVRFFLEAAYRRQFIDMCGKCWSIEFTN